MGILNKLFGTNERLAREIERDAEKRITIWKAYVKSRDEDDVLVRRFNYGTIDEALRDLKKLDATLAALQKRVPKEIVEVDEEEKLDEEIVADLERMSGAHGSKRSREIKNAIIAEEKKLPHCEAYLKHAHDLLTTRLHTIRVLRGYLRLIPPDACEMLRTANLNSILAATDRLGIPKSVKEITPEISSDSLKVTLFSPQAVASLSDGTLQLLVRIYGMLIQLYELVCNREDGLYNLLTKGDGRSEDELNVEDLAEIRKIVHSILIEERIEAEKKSAEDRFVKMMLEGMRKEGGGEPESQNHYRALAEEIYGQLADRAGGTDNSDDIVEGIRRLERIMKNDKVLAKIIRDLRPAWKEKMVVCTMQAFRKAYNLGAFMGLEAQFAT